MTPSEITEMAIRKFGMKPNPIMSTSSDLRFGNKGSISVCLTGERAGQWYSHEDKSGGFLPGLRARAPVREVRPAFTPSPNADKFQLIISAQLCGVDSEAAFVRSRGLRSPDAKTPARLYLESRGISRFPHSIRGWHQRGIAYIAQTKDGSVLAVQVMHLHENGTKNKEYWHDGVVKRTYCRVRGWNRIAAVRMPGRGFPILCEGPETGLSIWLATGRPVYATLGMAGLRSLHLPTKRVTIARDADPEGSAADEAFKRLCQRCDVVTPPAVPGLKKTDFNDVHLHYGLEAVAEAFKK